MLLAQADILKIYMDIASPVIGWLTVKFVMVQVLLVKLVQADLL